MMKSQETQTGYMTIAELSALSGISIESIKAWSNVEVSDDGVHIAAVDVLEKFNVAAKDTKVAWQVPEKAVDALIQVLPAEERGKWQKQFDPVLAQQKDGTNWIRRLLNTSRNNSPDPTLS